MEVGFFLYLEHVGVAVFVAAADVLTVYRHENIWTDQYAALITGTRIFISKLINI